MNKGTSKRLEEILKSLEIEYDGHYVRADRLGGNYVKLDDKAITQVLEAIHQEVRRLIPEKKNTPETVTGFYQYDMGYNHAVDDMEKNIKEGS